MLLYPTEAIFSQKKSDTLELWRACHLFQVVIFELNLSVTIDNPGKNIVMKCLNHRHPNVQTSSSVFVILDKSSCRLIASGGLSLLTSRSFVLFAKTMRGLEYHLRVVYHKSHRPRLLFRRRRAIRQVFVYLLFIFKSKTEL